MSQGRKKRLVVLTGAGMSAESGLSTFRDADGLWENEPVAEVATHEAILRDPARCIRFANKLRLGCAAAQPNAGHKLLAELEQDYDVTIVTQNIDDLHERAGSSHVIHLHGELMKCCTMDDPETPLPLPDGELEMSIDATDRSGRRLRPFIVYFGEGVPRMSDAIRATMAADIFLIIGTSLVVYPAAGLSTCAPSGIPKFLIDPKSVPVPGDFEQIHEGASAGVRHFVDLLRERNL